MNLPPLPHRVGTKILGATLTLTLALLAINGFAATKPNIVVIVADDLG